MNTDISPALQKARELADRHKASKRTPETMLDSYNVERETNEVAFEIYDSFPSIVAELEKVTKENEWWHDLVRTGMIKGGKQSHDSLPEYMKALHAERDNERSMRIRNGECVEELERENQKLREGYTGMREALEGIELRYKQRGHRNNEELLESLAWTMADDATQALSSFPPLQ